MAKYLLVIILLFVVEVSARAVFAHGGGLDSLGCHHNRQAGGYHCHQGPLAGQFFRSKQEALQGMGGNNPTPIAPRRCCKICKKGVPCGNSCISASYVCRKPPGCAC